MTDFDDVLMDAAETVGRRYGMTGSQIVQQVAIGDIPHPGAPAEDCGATDPRDEKKWCVRPAGHDGDHNSYAPFPEDTND